VIHPETLSLLAEISLCFWASSFVCTADYNAM